jgi:hypothetical protein
MRYLIILLLGLVLGGAAVIFFLGAPRVKSAPGSRVQPPEAGGDPAGTVAVTLNDQFFDELLGTVFRDLGPPSFRLSQVDSQAEPTLTQRATFQDGCPNTVTLVPESSNIKTHVHFAGGKISAPLAFSGSYNLVGNCVQFKGWADTSIQLSFDRASQTVYGQLSVDGINLEGVAPFANNFVTIFVQNAINQRVNPLELLRAPQLELLIPVVASNGTVKARVRDVRAEVLDGSLRLHITYDFSGVKGQQKQG